MKSQRICSVHNKYTIHNDSNDDQDNNDDVHDDDNDDAGGAVTDDLCVFVCTDSNLPIP